MASRDFYTWNPVLHFEMLRGAPGNFDEEFKRRTLSFKYIDRAQKFDTIEWDLNNSDGLLTQPQYLALGVVVRIRLGYLGAETPWRTLIINRIRGGVGVTGSNRALGEKESRVTYSGRNRNAKAPKNYRKSKKIYGPTQDVTQYDRAATIEETPGRFRTRRFSDAVKQIAEDMGYSGSYALIEDTPEGVEEVVIPVGKPIGLWLSESARRRGFIFRIDDRGFHFHSARWGKAENQRIAREYVYGSGADILDLQIDGDFRLPIPTTVQMQGTDPMNRRAHAAGTGSAGVNIASAVLKGSLDASDRIKNLTRSYIGHAGCATQMASPKATQHFIERHLQSFKIKLHLVGDPAILAGRRVRLSGTGSPLVDQVWFVDEVEHYFSGETYTTTLALKMPPKMVPQDRVRAWTKGEGGGVDGGKGSVAGTVLVGMKALDSARAITPASQRKK